MGGILVILVIGFVSSSSALAKRGYRLWGVLATRQPHYLHLSLRTHGAGNLDGCARGFLFAPHPKLVCKNCIRFQLLYLMDIRRTRSRVREQHHQEHREIHCGPSRELATQERETLATHVWFVLPGLRCHYDISPDFSNTLGQSRPVQDCPKEDRPSSYNWQHEKLHRSTFGLLCEFHRFLNTKNPP